MSDLTSRYHETNQTPGQTWEDAVAAAEARAEIATELSTAPITTPEDAAAVLCVISDQLSVDELSPQHPARLLIISLYNYLIALDACVIGLVQTMTC